MLFNKQPLLNPWKDGGVISLRVFEFWIITLFLQLVLNFNYSPKGGIQSYY
jgi:hypothetical protein